ncbi:MAG TPA: UDP-glucose/GDP-mannose dehydrogenase family protein, partial [Alphaproteobacteria bacterium]|nr:UDP-glucose/GDP-mannose dehydrogenase family protein [Alphaproteobacteria bacterium]
QMADKVIAACGGQIRGKKIAILGLTFKPNTDDIRDAPSLDIISALQAAGARISAYDPVGMVAAKGHVADVSWGNSAYDILGGAAALVIITEWNEFRALDLARIKSLMAAPLIVDLRNIYRLAEMREEGIRYVSVGRPEIEQ